MLETLAPASTSEQYAHFGEKCGLFLRFTPYPTEHFTQGKKGSTGVSHRGPHGWGAALEDDSVLKTFHQTGLLQESTPNPQGAESVRGYWAAFQNRYGTKGEYEPYNLQPMAINMPDGSQAAVLHNGEFNPYEDLKKRVKGNIPEGASDTYLFTKLLEQILREGGSLEHTLIQLLKGPQRVKSAYSLIVALANKVYAARDDKGIRPLIIGKENGALILTSETHALDEVGAVPIREVKPGEIVRLDENGITTIARGKDEKGAFCTMERVYFERADSMQPNFGRPEDRDYPERWEKIFDVRRRYGHYLAREHPIPHATRVVGVPRSGVPGGIGYAEELGIPYVQSIEVDEKYEKENGPVRSFLHDENKNGIGDINVGKLRFKKNPDYWKGQVVVIRDDSLMRANVSPRVAQAARILGAAEVHLLLDHPPTEWTCHLATSIRTREELIYYRMGGDLKKIADHIGVDSVAYLSPKGFLSAEIGEENVIVPDDLRDIFLANGFCGGCVTGRYPVDKFGNEYQPPTKLKRELIVL